jgi:deoxyribose-phosphate aldolase
VRLASIIDHSLLRFDATRAQVETLCDEALRHGFAAVCVNPIWVKACAAHLRGSAVRVCSVVGFPFGATLFEVKAMEAGAAREDGATEFDMVANLGALRDGDAASVCRDIEAVVRAAHGGIVKVILETGALTDDLKVLGCRLARDAGAKFVKTSTGFGPGGATESDVALLSRTVGPSMGVKAAGGIRDAATARRLVAAGATRIGTSSGVAIAEADVP